MHCTALLQQQFANAKVTRLFTIDRSRCRDFIILSLGIWGSSDVSIESVKPFEYWVQSSNILSSKFSGSRLLPLSSMGSALTTLSATSATAIAVHSCYQWKATLQQRDNVQQLPRGLWYCACADIELFSIITFALFIKTITYKTFLKFYTKFIKISSN